MSRTGPTRWQAEILRRAEDIVRAQARLLAAWRAGYLTGHQDGWKAGYERAHADRDQDWSAFAKPVARELARSVGLMERRWGPGGREHFADPRPGDYPGGEYPPRQALVWLAGPPVHRHVCSDACYAYAPGAYSPAQAAEVLATLPGGYEGSQK